MLSLPDHLLGREVYRVVQQKVGSPAGVKVSLAHGTSPLWLTQSLWQQGLVRGNDVTLHCTYVATSVSAAWCHIHGWNSDERALEGVLELDGIRSLQFIKKFPESLKYLTFDDCFNEGVEGLELPGSLEGLIFGRDFNSSLEHTVLPESLQNLRFGKEYNQNLDDTTLPSNLAKLTFGAKFNQTVEHVNFPSSLKSLTFGDTFNQSLGGGFRYVFINLLIPSEFHCIRGCP